VWQSTFAAQVKILQDNSIRIYPEGSKIENEGSLALSHPAWVCSFFSHPNHIDLFWWSLKAPLCFSFFFFFICCLKIRRNHMKVFFLSFLFVLCSNIYIYVYFVQKLNIINRLVH
jgi:hypothetical protein